MRKYAKQCSVTGEGMNEGYVYVDAETEFNEPGCQVHGVAWVYSDGTYVDEYVEQEFLDSIEFDEDTSLYTYNGEEYEVFEEIIEDHYSTWKENNL